MYSDSGPGRTEQLGPRFLFLSLIAVIAAAPLMVAGHLAASLLLLVVLTGYNALLYLYPGANRSFRDGKYVPPFFIFFITMFAAWTVAFYRFDEPVSHWLIDNTTDYASNYSYGIILSTYLEEGYVGVAGRLVRRRAWRYEEIDTVVVFSDKEPDLVHAVVGSSLSVGDKVWIRSGDSAGRLKTLSEQLRTFSTKRLIWDYRLTEFDFGLEINEEDGALQRMRLTRLP